MIQRAVVTRAVGAGKVEVSVERMAACGHSCAGCAGCGAADQSARITAVARDPFGVRAGQRVSVESMPKPALWYGFLLYLLPFVGLLIAAAALRNFREGTAALGSVAVFVGLLAGVSLPLERYLRRHKAVTYRVVAVEEG